MTSCVYLVILSSCHLATLSGGRGGEALDRLFLILVDIGILGQADHAEDFLEVLRQTADRQLLIIAVHFGHNTDQNRNASTVNIIVLPKVQQDMLRALASYLSVGTVNLLLGKCRDIADEIDNRNAIALARTNAQLIFQHGILLKN